MLNSAMAGSKKHIPNSLRKHRKLMGFSQVEIKKRLKLKSTSIISRWERGISMPSGRNLLKLSTLYKTLANELYYTLAKEFQEELFPAEREIIRNSRRRAKKRSDRGP
jgi:transcriptional regulator with XRE-family HTH domain